jgi:transcriptional regulator with XRE-family HTH domain
LTRVTDPDAPSDALPFLERLVPDTPETRRVGKQEWARLLLTEAMRAARRDARLTQEQVAERLGVTQGWVSRLEHAGHDHTLESVIAYLDAVGADLEFRVIDQASRPGAGEVPPMSYQGPTDTRPRDALQSQVTGSRLLEQRLRRPSTEG